MSVEIGRMIRVEKIFVDIDVRGTFAMTSTNAEFPKSANASAVGGVQSGLEGPVLEGYAWLVTGCAGKKFAGMTSNFVADQALVVAAGNSPASTPADWVIDESGVVSGVIPTPNQPPTVSIISPSTGGSVTVNTAVAVVYTASDLDGTIASVKLVVDGVEQSLTPSGNTFTYTPTTTGSKSIAVRVIDDDGSSVTSTPITLTVTAVVNVPPTVSINSPSDNAQIDEGDSVTITFTAADSDGTLSSIKLVVDGVEQSLTASGNTFNYTPSADGSYELAVRVTDDDGATVTSTPITLVVNPVSAPTVETFMRAVNFGDDARNFNNRRHESYKTGTTPAGMTATQIYFNNSAVFYSQYSPSVTDIEQFEATRTFAYNLQNVRFTGLANGTYKVYMMVQRLYNTGASILEVNGQSVTVQAGSSGPVWVTVSATVTVSAGTLTIHDPTTSGSEGEVQLCYLELFKVVPASTAAPATPTGLTISRVGYKTMTLTWDAAINAEGYRILMKSGSPTGSYTQVAEVAGNMTHITGLTQNTAYNLKVVSYNTSGASAESSVVSDTTGVFTANKSLGDSYTNSVNAPGDGYIEKLVASYGITNTNLAESARGAFRAAKAANTLGANATHLSGMFGLNDERRNGAATGTVNKITNCLKSILAKHWRASAVAASDASVTRSGVWNPYVAGYDGEFASTLGGLPYFTQLSSAYMTWAFSGSTLTIGYLATVASFAVFDVYIEDASGYVYTDDTNPGTARPPWLTVTPNGGTDGVTDDSAPNPTESGTHTNARVPASVIITDIPYANSIVKIQSRCTGSDFCLIDWLGTLVSPSVAKPYWGFQIPYITPTGYGIVPNLGSNAAADTCSNAAKAVLTTLKNAGYPANYVPLRRHNGKILAANYSNMDADEIHPDNFTDIYLDLVDAIEYN